MDQGSEFKCEHFEHVWCKTQDILPRFGAVGKHGSIAVVERFHRTLKELPRLTTIPENQTEFEHELELIIDWYNEHRPHETLPRFPRKREEKVERDRRRVEKGGASSLRLSSLLSPLSCSIAAERQWPRGSPCTAPAVGIEGDPGDPIIFEIDCLDGRRHLPLIRVRRAA